MNQNQMSECLRALPRAKASPAFTRNVIRAARVVDQRRPAFVWRFAAAFAMVVCLLAVVQFATMQYKRQRLAELRAEQQKIEAELAAVKKSAAETEPVVVLENDKGARVIMDLDSAVQPASLKTFD